MIQSIEPLSLLAQPNLTRNFMTTQFHQVVPDFGGQSLDTDPNFGKYRHFCGTIIDVRTDRNANKRSNQH